MPTRHPVCLAQVILAGSQVRHPLGDWHQDMKQMDCRLRLMETERKWDGDGYRFFETLNLKIRFLMFVVHSAK